MGTLSRILNTVVPLAKLLLAVAIIAACFTPTLYVGNATIDKYNEFRAFDAEEEDDRYEEYTIKFEGVTETYDANVDNLYNQSELTEEELERLEHARLSDGYVFVEGEETEIIGNTTRNFAVDKNGTLHLYSLSSTTVGYVPSPPVISLIVYIIGTVIIGFFNIWLLLAVGDSLDDAGMFDGVKNK